MPLSYIYVKLTNNDKYRILTHYILLVELYPRLTYFLYLRTLYFQENELS